MVPPEASDISEGMDWPFLNPRSPNTARVGEERVSPSVRMVNTLLQLDGEPQM